MSSRRTLVIIHAIGNVLGYISIGIILAHVLGLSK
jgi:hypothetical protein